MDLKWTPRPSRFTASKCLLFKLSATDLNDIDKRLNTSIPLVYRVICVPVLPVLAVQLSAEITGSEAEQDIRLLTHLAFIQGRCYSIHPYVNFIPIGRRNRCSGVGRIVAGLFNSLLFVHRGFTQTDEPHAADVADYDC
jgi:hypothetical protein